MTCLKVIQLEKGRPQDTRHPPSASAWRRADHRAPATHPLPLQSLHPTSKPPRH